MNSINASFPINNNNAGNHNSIESILERWTPRGKPNLDFFLNGAYIGVLILRAFLQKCEETTHFNKEELKEIIYQGLDHLRPGKFDDFGCAMEATLGESNSNRHFLLFLLNNFFLEKEKLDIISSTRESPMSTRLFQYFRKLALGRLIHEEIHKKYPHSQLPEVEKEYVSYDFALKKQLRIPLHFQYLNIDENLLSTETSQAIIGKLRNRFVEIIIDHDYFKDHCTTLPEYHNDMNRMTRELKKRNFELNGLRRNILWSGKEPEYQTILKKYANKLYDEELQKENNESEILELFSNIKNAAQ